jgi:hypothetical protein
VLGNILPWMVEKKWCKNTKRFCFFFLRPNSRGRPAQAKISQRWKIKLKANGPKLGYNSNRKIRYARRVSCNLVLFLLFK